MKFRALGVWVSIGYNFSIMSSNTLERLNRELFILNTIAEALNRTPSLDQILRVTLGKLAELLDLHTAWVWLIQEENGRSYLAASQNLPPALKSKPERMEGSCYCLDTYQAGDLEGAANVNFITCSRLKFLEETEGLRYHTSIPLYANEKKLGVLNVASADWRELSEDELRLLHTAGDMLGMAIERARLFNRSHQLGALEERDRLAREIHDTLAQGMTGIAMSLETIDALLESGAPADRVQAQVRAALALTRANLDEARRSVLDLRAAPLKGRSLPEAINELADSYRNNWNLHVIVTTIGRHQPLPPRIEVGLYRVVQEALSNALKHAQAMSVAIQLKLLPDQVALTVQDNGTGFETETLPEGRFGLIGMNERVKLLGGTFEIQSAAGQGTRLVVSIPLDKP